MAIFKRLALVAAAVAMVATLGLSAVAVAQDEIQPFEPSEGLADLGGKVVADGSSTVGPVTEAVAEEFTIMLGENDGGSVGVEVSISGTGGGFSRFCAGETDLQNASRSIREDEVQACADAGVDWFVFEVAYDGIANVVNPANDWVECLTVEQLNLIWAPERAEMWSDIDASWPEETINLYGPGTDSGTFDYFTDEINGDEGVSTTDFIPSEDDNQLVAGVVGDENAMAYFGLAYYENNADSLKLLQVDGGNGCVTPSPETVQSGEYIPLSRPLFVYVNAASLERPEVQEFMNFYIANAAVLAPDVGYVASPVEAYIEDQTKLDAAISGEGTPDSQMMDESEG